ncbi:MULTISPECIES: hypothetical protein [unclassified Methylobacterium]|uniref:hypothetical protein n=1 Tax=unclassified Methylobacterium TaxID=2615210 RepID=UPI0018DF7C69|nr:MULTISPECIES: hypothetical protein [Methylobacterium]WFT82127.1 hypothetical protein QA634_09895 [Methylobacterium nodulans]
MIGRRARREEGRHVVESDRDRPRHSIIGAVRLDHGFPKERRNSNVIPINLDVIMIMPTGSWSSCVGITQDKIVQRRQTTVRNIYNRADNIVTIIYI